MFSLPDRRSPLSKHSSHFACCSAISKYYDCTALISIITWIWNLLPACPLAYDLFQLFFHRFPDRLLHDIFLLSVSLEYNGRTFAVHCRNFVSVCNGRNSSCCVSSYSFNEAASQNLQDYLSICILPFTRIAAFCILRTLLLIAEPFPEFDNAFLRCCCKTPHPAVPRIKRWKYGFTASLLSAGHDFRYPV